MVGAMRRAVLVLTLLSACGSKKSFPFVRYMIDSLPGGLNGRATLEVGGVVGQPGTHHESGGYGQTFTDVPDDKLPAAGSLVRVAYDSPCGKTTGKSASRTALTVCAP